MPSSLSPARIRAAREAAGLSRERAALAVDRSYHAIVQYESGQTNPSSAILLALAETYGVKVEDLTEKAPA